MRGVDQSVRVLGSVHRVSMTPPPRAATLARQAFLGRSLLALQQARPPSPASPQPRQLPENAPTMTTWQIPRAWMSAPR